MAMSVVYTTIDGVLVHEDRGGVKRQYIGDPLGSLVGELDENQNLTYTAEYWPYGEVRIESGNKQSEWGFVGLLGYLKDLATLLYVRARHYIPQKARWVTVDPLWPQERAYGYGNTSPTVNIDPRGNQSFPRLIRKISIENDSFDWLIDLICCMSPWHPLCRFAQYRYGRCCGLMARCNGPADGIDCLDKACGRHDSCLSDGSKYRSIEKQCQCLKLLCRDIQRCSCKNTRHPKECLQGKRDVGNLYCHLLPAILGCHGPVSR